MRKIRYFFDEWQYRFIAYWKWNKKIIFMNKGYIQWDDYSYIHRSGWYDTYTIEQMEEMGKELKR